jgi:hypothetical protein
MSESYRAILLDGHLRWLDEVPDAIRHGTQEVRVRVTVEEAEQEDEDELEPLLDALAEADPYGEIDDPREWQRQLRGESDVD